MRFVFALYLLLAGNLEAADDARGILVRIRDRVVDAVSRSDNYICVQDLARFYYVASAGEACRQPPAVPASPLRVEDRLKLDVAVSEGAEIYSWHGEHKFSGGSVGQLVREGPISSGGFNGYLRNIFAEHGVGFTYRGIATESGVDIHRFDYDVPLAASHYQVEAGKGMVLVPFHGSLSARVDNFDLYSLSVVADGAKMAKQSNLCAALTDIRYQVVPIGGRNTLLPSAFDLKMGARTQVFTESKGTYTNCHEYRGESTVRFDPSDADVAATAPSLAETEPLGAGILLQIGLQTPIDEDSAYAGQPVTAVLTHNTKIDKGKVLERGATLNGVITGFQVYHLPYHYVALRLEFFSITDGKRIYLCNARHDARRNFPTNWSRVPLREETHGFMIMDGGHLRLDDSFKSVFVTVDHEDSETR